MTERTHILEARDLVKHFELRRGVAELLRRERPPSVTALDEVSLLLAESESVGVVGESGSGKSTLAHALVRLIEVDSGEISVLGHHLRGAGPQELQAIRRGIQLIYQDPYSSLNPGMSVGAAVSEPAWVHGLIERGERAAFAVERLERVGLTLADAKRQPSQLSGGQRQRVAIARALAVDPKILIADEAVSALDVSIQAQILNLFRKLRSELGVAVVLISHQLAVIASLVERVAVMYLGRVVEEGPVGSVFEDSHHPYTKALIAAHPHVTAKRSARKPALKGEVPSGLAVPSGCRFRTRCPLAEDICAELDPPPVEVAPGHTSRCHVLAPSPAVARGKGRALADAASRGKGSR